MRSLLIKNTLTFFVQVLFFYSQSFAGVYEVIVDKISGNRYETISGFIIETKFCYEYSYSEEAILKYGQSSYDNKLIFLDSEEFCDVEKVFKK